MFSSSRRRSRLLLLFLAVAAPLRDLNHVQAKDTRITEQDATVLASQGSDSDSLNVESVSKEERSSASCSPESTDNGSTTCGAATADAASDDGEECEEDGSSPKSMLDFMRVFKRLGTSWSHVFGAYMDVVKTAHGKEMGGDVYADNVGMGVTMLQDMIDQAEKDTGGKDTKEGRKWSFEAVPFHEFDSTLEDIFVAFLRWSGVDSSDEDAHDECDLRGGVNKKAITPINVSKAFRRLEAYASWMDEQKDDLLDPPLTFESVRTAKDLLYSKVTHDDCGRVVWWLDIGQTNFGEMKHLPSKEILRFFVWLSHLVMTDESAQVNGILFLDSMDSVSFYQYMTMLPLQLGLTIDKFMIGVTPLKTKLVVFMKRPLWFDVGFGLLSVFLPKKMKKRVELPVGDQHSIEDIVGIKNIPVGFDSFNGTLAVDMIAKHEERSADGSKE